MSMDLIAIGNDVTAELKQQSVNLPANYSPANALAAAYLIIKETVDMNKRTALEVCSPESVKQALLKMIVQGLNPIKDQCYFVVYANKLTMQRSYMGSIALAKSVNPNISDIRAKVIYEGDDIDIETVNCIDIVKRHKPIKFTEQKKENIIGAYAMALNQNGEIHSTVIMTMDEIKISWQQSKQKGIVLSDGKINPEKTHGKFTGEMCIRTVVNRLCKPIINTSDDMTLLQSANETDEEISAADIMQAEVDEHANQKVIDFQPNPKDPVNGEPKKDDGPQMATIEQARTITGLSQELNQKEKMMDEISGFFNHEVGKISELTFDQAAEYITVLNEQLKDIPKDQQPDWA